MRTVIAALALSLPGLAAAADPVDDILAAAAADCSGFENGVFDAADAVVEVDLDGQEPLDRLVDTSRFTCSSAASMYCGSGGCSLHAVVGDESWEFQAEGWRMIDWDGLTILLVARDGGWCGGAGSQICFEAVNWSAGSMLTVMPPPG
jgi:hypothetical protein